MRGVPHIASKQAQSIPGPWEGPRTQRPEIISEIHYSPAGVAPASLPAPAQKDPRTHGVRCRRFNSSPENSCDEARPENEDWNEGCPFGDRPSTAAKSCRAGGMRVPASRALFRVLRSRHTV